ncbi:MAG: replicative DNA helicase [Gammaproteobacteria bacterium]|nr:replicative DNA helicase [Gammaproteobacteria bacterium]
MIRNIIYVEQSIIGAVIRNSDLYDDVSDIICPADFSGHFNFELFELISLMLEDSENVDVVTLSTAYENKTGRDHLSEIGTMAKNSSGGANIKHYAGLVKKNSIEMKLLKAGQDIIAMADSGQSTADKINAAQDMVMSLADKNVTTGLRTTKEIMKDVVVEMDRRCSMDGSIIGLSTGIDQLDKMTGGLQEADLFIIAGRPSMGKTTIAMNIGENVALGPNGKDGAVLIYSLEMPDRKITERSISSTGRISHSNMKSGMLSEAEWNKFTPASAALINANILIDDSAGMSVNEMRSKTRRAMRKGNISLIIIDYLQLMDYGDAQEVQALTSISRGLKAMAKDAKCPVICLSQLSRSVEQRPDKRPILSDLRGSGAIEQDADIVAFMYRDEYYNHDSPDKGLAEMIIAKQRDGETGTVALRSRLDQMRFEDHPEGLSEKENWHTAGSGKFEY